MIRAGAIFLADPEAGTLGAQDEADLTAEIAAFLTTYSAAHS